MNYTIKNNDIADFNESEPFEFPKYTSQLINWANQNAQGTQPVVVGQMSDLFPEFLNSDKEKTIDGCADGMLQGIRTHLRKQLRKSGYRSIIFAMQFLS